MTTLRGVDFGPVWTASGTQGFFGEGYWFHNLSPWFDELQKTTFVAKTVTFGANKGNMALDKTTWRPLSLFPNCIRINPFKGIAINAVGLSNFGIKDALTTLAWQKRTKHFMLSFMPIAKTKADRLQETRRYVTVLKYALPTFTTSIALQVNLSCPNTGEDLKELEAEAVEILSILDELQIPLVPKFNVLTTPETVMRIAHETRIDCVCVSNTLPYGKLEQDIAWEKMFGKVSPLKDQGGGGLSGAPLFPLVQDWLQRARRIGLTIPINAGGGIMHAWQVDELFMAGASSVSIGTVALLRPWRIADIVRTGQKWRAL